MPTYHYRCSNCAHEFEQGQSIKDAPLNTCPECKQQTIHRVISAGGGAIFKGSGFYHTDYKNAVSGKKEETSSASPAAAKPADSSPPPAAAPAPEKK